MRSSTKYLAIALILGMSAGTAQAAIHLGFDFGNVAIGYSDGYYDHSHHWHNWRRHDDMLAWRRDHFRDYHEWRHDDWRHR
jgi:hypothetical protein